RPGQRRGGRLPAGPRPPVRYVQPLLLVLRHPRHVPARRRRLVPLELPGPRRDRPPPAPPGPRRRELGPRRQPLPRQGGPRLLPRPGGAVAGGLPPLPPALRRAHPPPRRRPRPPPRRRPRPRRRPPPRRGGTGPLSAGLRESPSVFQPRSPVPHPPWSPT